MSDLQLFTGWQAPVSPHLPLTYADKLGIDPHYKVVSLDRHVIYNILLNKGINAQMYRVYLYLMDCELMQTRPSPSEICKYANVSQHIEDWKTGFGQVLAKAPAYPQHDKRLHLFGTSDHNFRNIKPCCQEFAISVSLETASLQIV